MRLILCLLALSFSLSATTYYVSNSGSDAANGTSTSTPWQTISHVNAQTFQPGDSVMFNKGDSWREVLTVPSSGVAGNPITFGAYGSGAAPCFYCEPVAVFSATAESGDMSEWTAVTASGASSVTADHASLYHGGSSPASQPGYGFDVASDGTNFTYANKTIPGQSVIWVKFYVFVPPSFSESANFNNTYIFNLNSAGTTKLHAYIQQTAANQYTVHSQLNFGSFTNIGGPTFSGGTWHRVDIEYVVNSSTGGLQFWWDGVSQGSNFTANSSGNIDAVQIGFISQNAPSAGAHLYFDNIKAATSSLVAVNTAVDTNAKSYVTFNGVAIANAGDVGFYVHGGSTGVSLIDSSIHDIDANTFRAAVFQNGANNTVYSGDTIYNAEDGIAISGYTSVANSTSVINNTTIFNMGRHGIQVAPAGGTGPDHVTMSYNSISYCAQWVNDSVGILIDGTGVGNTASYNLSFNHGTATTWGEDYDSDLTATGNVWSFNVGYGSTNGCFITSGSGNSFYNNTCYNDNTQSFTDGELSLYTNASNIVAKNNIFYGSAGKPIINVQSGSTTGDVFNDNVYFGGSATPFTWGGTAYGYSAYKTASSQDANSLNTDPQMMNPSAASFSLQETSPARNAGIAISGYPFPYGAPDLGAIPFYAKSANTLAF